MAKIMRVCGIVLTLNEAPRIEECLKYLKPHVSYLLVLDDESTDNTVEIARKYADKVVVKHLGPGMAEKRNYAMRLAPKWCGWILFCDADERFDYGWLSKLKRLPEQGVNCFRFPRLNLPNPGFSYPDWQVRFFRNDIDFEWRNEGHPDLGNDLLYSKKEDKRLDQLPRVTTLDSYPILHLPRRNDIRRPWW